jgi:hypothetical protein
MAKKGVRRHGDEFWGVGGTRGCLGGVGAVSVAKRGLRLEIYSARVWGI